MAFTEFSENRLVWQYALPAKKDRTLLYKILQAYIITIVFIAGLFVLLSILLYAPWDQMLLGFVLIGGFLTAVMIVCYPLTILLIKLILLYLRLLSRLVNGGKRRETDKCTSEKKDTACILYRFAADEETLHSWAAVETKGGKHIRYRAIRKMTRCKGLHWIEVYRLLDRTTIYAEDADFETVWQFISARCPKARIIEEES